MVLVEVLIVLSLIILAILTGWGWFTGKRKFYREAVAGAREIDSLARDVYSERSREKCAQLNQMINAWNARFAGEFGPIPNVDCSTF